MNTNEVVSLRVFMELYLGPLNVRSIGQGYVLRANVQLSLWCSKRCARTCRVLSFALVFKNHLI